MTKTFLKTFKRFAGNLLAPKPGSIARDIHNRRLCCEPLEDRRLLAVALTYNIANYVQPGSEAIATLVANGANLEFKINGTLEDTQAMSDVSSIAVIGTPDKNVLDVDYRGGDIPAPISFDGGPDTSGDSAQIEGDGSQTAIYTPDAVTTGSGTILVGSNTIVFSGLEPVDITGMAVVALNLPGHDDVVNVDNGFDTTFGTTPALVLSGSSGGVAFESLHVWDNGTVVIDTTFDDGNDLVTVNSADNVHQNTNLTIVTGVGTDTVVLGTGTHGIAVSGTVTVSTGGSVVDSTSAVNVTANSLSIAAGAAYSLSTDVSNLTASTTAGDIAFVNTGAIQLLGVNAAGGFAINAGGAITDATGASVAVANDASLTGTSISLTDNAADDLSVGGNASFTATGGGSITVATAGTANFGSLTFNTTGAVSIAEDSATQLSGTSTANSLTLSSTAAINNAPSASLTVTGNASFGGTTIILGGQTGDTMNFGSLTFNSAGAVGIAEDSAMQLSGTSTANSLALSSTAAITNAASTNLTVTGNASFSGTSITLGNQTGDAMNFGTLTFSSAGAVTIAEDSAMQLSGTSTGGDVTLSSTAAINVPIGVQVLGTGAVTLNVGTAGAGSSSAIQGTISTGGVKVQVNGGNGSDTLTIDLATASLPQQLNFSGGNGSDSFVINGTSNADYINIIDGPTGVVKWEVAGPPKHQEDLLNYQSVENLYVNTLAGNDQVVFYMSNVPTTVLHMDGGTSVGTTGIRDGLQIVGTNGNDVAVVGNYNVVGKYSRPGYVDSLPPGVSFPFTTSLAYGFKVKNIQTLQLFGNAGNDILVDNVTGVPSLINGGAGNDLLIGGNSGNAIFGGAGKDCLYGGTAKDYLFADHDFLIRGSNGLPVAFQTDGDVVRGRGGADIIVALGQDNVDSGGKGATVIGQGLSLSVLDWLQAKRPSCTPGNINTQLQAAIKLFYANFFTYGVHT